MCRMSAITATDLPPNLTTYMLDFMMARSSADEGQTDGWGVSMLDQVILKSPDPYWSTPPHWMARWQEMDNRMVMGHVRKASQGTDKYSVSAPHPYFYTTMTNEVLLLQHNGWIDGTPRHQWAVGVPNTDSFRAGVALIAILNRHIAETGDADLTDAVLTEWVGTFYAGSVYVFFILYRKSLIVVRGNSARTMYVGEVGNGYAFATSKPVLDATLFRFSQFGVAVSESAYISEHSITRVSEGQPDISVSAFNPSYAVWPVTGKHGNSSHAPPAAASFGSAASDTGVASSAGVTVHGASSNVLNVADAEYDDELGWSLQRQQKTRRTPRRKGGQGHHESAEDDLIKDAFTMIRTQLNPMRSTSILYWIADTYGLEKPGKGGPNLDAAMDLSAQDLMDFIEFAAPSQIMLAGDERGATGVLSKTQRHLINAFNHLVPSRQEYEVIRRFHAMFGTYYWQYEGATVDILELYLRHILTKPELLGDDPFDDGSTPSAAASTSAVTAVTTLAKTV